MTGPASTSVATSATAGPRRTGRTASACSTSRHDADGFLGGGQVGFNYQIGQFVLGAEGDFSWTGINGGSTLTGRRAGSRTLLQHRCELDLDPDRPPRRRVRSLARLRQGRRRLGGRQVLDRPLHLPRHGRGDRHAHRLDRRRWRRIRLRAALVGEARVQLHGLRQQGRFVRARERPPTSISRSMRSSSASITSSDFRAWRLPATKSVNKLQFGTPEHPLRGFSLRRPRRARLLLCFVGALGEFNEYRSCDLRRHRGARRTWLAVVALARRARARV